MAGTTSHRLRQSLHQEADGMSDHGHPSHGNSVAAWTCVGLLILAALVGSLAVILTSVPLAVGAVVLAVAGLTAGKVLSLAGYGAQAADDERTSQGVG